VFISSSLGELADERRVVERAVSSLRLTPVLFDLEARPRPPRDVYRAYVAQSDIFIGLYWQSYGQVPPGTRVSGLEEEFDLSSGLPRLLYVKAPAPDREPRLTELLKRVKGQISYRHFGTTSELARLVRDDIATLLSERFAAGSPVADEGSATVPKPQRSVQSLPVSATTLIGRESAIDDIVEMLERPDMRLVTLTGPGGVGKTRLAVAVGERVRGRFPAGVVFVPLAAITKPELVWAAIGRAAGADLTGSSEPLGALIEQLGDGSRLLILDNLEQVADVARDLDALLTTCSKLAILATSRSALRLRAEQEYPVSPLSTGDPAMPLDEIASLPAVALFVDRARAVNHGFTLTDANAAAVAEVCRRLDGLPLAIELAATRTRLLDPTALLNRLTTSLDALGTGPVDLPERQHTLRATVDWSVGLLSDAERAFLEASAVFVDGWTIDAATRVVWPDEDEALEWTEALVRHSLVRIDRTELGPRARLPETIHEFIAERLAARSDVQDIRRRHADYYRALAERADRPLVRIDHTESLERLQSEAGNLASAVHWYLAHDREPLPHLFRVLWSFWFLRDHQKEARAWVDELLPAVDSMAVEPRAELLWTAQVSALEMGNDTAAVSAGERIGPLLNRIDDPFLGAVAKLAMAWTAPIVEALDESVRQASKSLEQLRTQDEPFWTALALGTLGTVEAYIDHVEDANTHLREAHDVADQFNNRWLAGWSRALLSTLAIRRGQLDEARSYLDEAMVLSLASHSTSSVTLCFVAYARLAYVTGDPQRSALLLGAADGLRKRVKLRAWPMLRRGEAALNAEVRAALGTERFDAVYGSGSRLNRWDAVAVVRDRQGAGTIAS
jgi:predicted ATPase